MSPDIHKAFSKSSKYYDKIYLNKMPEMYEETLQEFYDIAKALGVSLNSIVDIGCGTGNHAIRMAQNGIQVTGVDLSTGQLAAASAKVSSLGLDIQLIQEDMARLDSVEVFSEENIFDAAASFCSSFCYLLEDEAVLRFLRSMDRVIKPGGFLYFEFWNILAAKPGTERIYEGRDGDIKLLRTNINRFDVNTGVVTLPFKHIIWKGKEVLDEFTEEHHLRCYSIPQLRTLVSQTNWELHEVFSGRFRSGKEERAPKLDDFRYYAILTH